MGARSTVFDVTFTISFYSRISTSEAPENGGFGSFLRMAKHIPQPEISRLADEGFF
jgi:hypothetical protein